MHKVKLLLHSAIQFRSFTIFPSPPAHWSCVNWRLRWRPASWRMMYRICTSTTCGFSFLLSSSSLAPAIWMPPSSIGLPWYRCCCVGCEIWPQFVARGIKVQLWLQCKVPSIKCGKKKKEKNHFKHAKDAPPAEAPAKVRIALWSHCMSNPGKTTCWSSTRQVHYDFFSHLLVRATVSGAIWR